MRCVLMLALALAVGCNKAVPTGSDRVKSEMPNPAKVPKPESPSGSDERVTLHGKLLFSTSGIHDWAGLSDGPKGDEQIDPLVQLALSDGRTVTCQFRQTPHDKFAAWKARTPQNTPLEVRGVRLTQKRGEVEYADCELLPGGFK